MHGADLVVLAMPLPAVAPALESVAAHLLPGAVLTDVGTLEAPGARGGAALRAACTVRRRPPAGRHRGERLGRDRPAAVSRRAVDADARGRQRPERLGRSRRLRLRSRRPTGAATAAEQDAAVARVIGLPHVLAEALALTGLAGGPLGLSLAAGSYRSGSRVARTRPELVATWCDGNPALVDALDDVIARLTIARDELAAENSMFELAAAGHAARMDWEHRQFVPVELPATARRAAGARTGRRLDHRGAARRHGAAARNASGGRRSVLESG